jgi:hypothetical protein
MGLLNRTEAGQKTAKKLALHEGAALDLWFYKGKKIGWEAWTRTRIVRFRI